MPELPSSDLGPANPHEPDSPRKWAAHVARVLVTEVRMWEHAHA